MTISTFIKEVPGKGMGVFSVNAVKQGDIVWLSDPYFDITIPDSEVKKMAPVQQEYLNRYAYTTPETPDMWELDVDNGRFMNHSRNPNTAYNLEKGWATRDIAAGEEITCDYRSFDTQPINFTETE